MRYLFLFRYRLPALLMLGLALPACGFHLRGAVEMPPALQYTVAEGLAPYSDLGEALSRAWRQSGAQLEFGRGADAEAARLVINRDEVSRRTLSVDSAGRPNEYELRYQVDFTLRDAAGRTLLKNQSAMANRAYQFNPDNALAMDDEEQRLKRVLAEDIAVQMLRRITFQVRNRPADEPDAGQRDASDDETAR